MVSSNRDSACLDDSAILAFAQGELQCARLNQAEAHIDQCAVCRRLVAAALAGSAAKLGADRSFWGGCSLTPGAMVADRYRIDGLLGRGGMGEVYRALDTLLGESVALKCVSAVACEDPRALRRLRGEAQLARRVTHPHVCRVFDVGLQDDSAQGAEPLLFLTMELLEGPTLGARIRATGRLDDTEALAIARQLASGLEAAHAAHVLHRDFKSDNVILQRLAETRAVITDFGLARDLTGGRSPTSHAHGLAGTPAYLAPEQIEGQASSVATDVYAFGVVLFEMTTGRPPFPAETALASMLKRLTEPAPRPRALVPDLDARLERVIVGCLERRPERRLASLPAVRAILEADQPRAQRAAPALRATHAWLALSLVALTALLAGNLRLMRSAGWSHSVDPPAVIAPTPDLEASSATGAIEIESTQPPAPAQAALGAPTKEQEEHDAGVNGAARERHEPPTPGPRVRPSARRKAALVEGLVSPFARAEGAGR
jgi:serine/threonine protein kinase